MKKEKRLGKAAISGTIMAGLLLLSACGKEAIPGKGSVAVPPVVTPETAESTHTEEETLQTIEILVGDATFSVQLADTNAARQLAERLPLELDMRELNGNEKYCYLSDPLPTAANRPDHIHTGDLMLFGSDCLVLFYEDFSTSYSYTPLGKMEDSQGLPEALGLGNIKVTLRKPSQSE